MKTTPRIKELPQDLIDQIAAGEVVERPASILKELIENSLDADADGIHILIEGAGRTRLVVSDNGYGMNRTEVQLAVKRHATSKISKFGDLYAIGSFGFRGEALPSMASVSRFRITTRSVEDDIGWEIEMEGSKILKQQPVAREPGTTVEVKDLFFNTPARFKFLKSDSTERAHCLRTIEELGLTALNVSFQIQIEKSKPMVYRKNEFHSDLGKMKSIRTRISDTWGGKWARGLEDVQSEGPHMSLSGCVTHAGNHQPSMRSQILFVNRRPVHNKRISKAVYEAFRGQLPTYRHPGWVLFLDVNPAAVDVNVHPTKREVKLTFDNEIFSFVMNAVRHSLSKSEKPPVDILAPTKTKEPVMADGPTKAAISKTNDLYQPLEMSLKPAARPPSLREGNYRAVAQIGQLYILCESETGLTILDQHAAHEKIIYEKLFSNMKSKDPEIQMMLVPHAWELSKSLFLDLKGHLGDFKKMGYLIEPFGDTAYLVKGYPRILGENYSLEKMLDGISVIFGDARSENFAHRLAAMTACKSAVKAGDTLNIRECQQLVNDLFTIEAPFTCPHGRPTFIRHAFAELDRKFQRT